MEANDVNGGAGPEGIQIQLDSQPVAQSLAPVGQSVNQPASQPTNNALNNPYSFVPSENLERFKSLCQQHEIHDLFALKLRQLEGFDIVLIADDSGSMTTRLSGTSMRRWDELKSSITTIVEIASCFDSDGIDIYFLNRAPLLNVNNPEMVTQAFSTDPNGGTPINATLNTVLAAKSSVEKKLLILILTDGEPTDGVSNLERTLRNRSSQCYVTFVACTDDDRVMRYLNGWDETIPRLDVIDDYASEKKEILAVQGAQFRFSHGDWIVKALLGSIDPEMDALDERKPGATTSCCVIS